MVVTILNKLSMSQATGWTRLTSFLLGLMCSLVCQGMKYLSLLKWGMCLYKYEKKEKEWNLVVIDGAKWGWGINSSPFPQLKTLLEIYAKRISKVYDIFHYPSYSWYLLPLYLDKTMHSILLENTFLNFLFSIIFLILFLHCCSYFYFYYHNFQTSPSFFETEFTSSPIIVQLPTKEVSEVFFSDNN